MKTLALLFLTVYSLFGLENFQVAFETTECNGDKGFATIDIAKINRIESDSCTYQGQKLQKMLVNKRGSYTVYHLTFREAREVMKDIRLYNRAKLKMMENTSPVIITK